MQEHVRWIPIYTSARTVAGFLGYPYLFNTRAQWIGFVTPDGSVYAVTGEYAGFLDPDPRFARILRHTDTAHLHPPVKPPEPPTFAPRTPWTVPLPPPPPRLPAGTVDVLASQPHLLPPHEEISHATG